MIKARKLIFLLMIGLCFESHSQEPMSIDQVEWRIGAHLGREFYTDLSRVPESLLSAANSTAEFGRSSGFYLGEFDGKHYFGAAAHTALSNFSNEILNFSDRDFLEQLCRVFPNIESSAKRQFKIQLGSVRFTCERALLLIPEIDFVLFEAMLSDGDLASFEPLKIRDISTSANNILSIFSYSSIGNPGFGLNFALMRSHDELCRVISSDPVIQSTITPLVEGWSREYSMSYVAIGCDSYPGDSGGPVVDNSTGVLLGMLSAGTRNKIYSLTQSERLIEALPHLPSYVTESLIWNDLTYMIPASEIYVRLQRERTLLDHDKELYDILSFLLQD
jgi:hypothetical protein